MRTMAILLLFIWAVGSSDRMLAQEIRSGAFPDVDAMESSLIRGVSTKSDVIALIGKPYGRGGAMSNLQPDRPREIWVYEELGASVIDSQSGVIRMHFARQFLMVYFVDGRFDGFWWHDTSAPISGAMLLGENSANQPPAQSEETPITTAAQFDARIVGRTLTNAAGTVRLVVGPDGQMSGKLKDGRSLSGPWRFTDGMFCRSPEVGGENRGWDCQFVTVSEDAAIFYRTLGEGNRMVYFFL